MSIQPRFLTFYSSIFAGLSCLVAFSAYIFHFSTTESCFAVTNSTINSTVTNLTVFDLEIASEPLTSDDLEDHCHTMTCTVVSLSVYTAALLTAVFGFEGSRKASSQKNCATCLFILQMIFGAVSLLGLLSVLILISFPQLKVCPGLLALGGSNPIFLTILLTTLLTLFILLISLLLGHKTRLNLRTIEYKSGAVY